MQTLTSLFLFVALYTPSIWLISNLTTKYGSLDSAPVLASSFAIFLLLMPIAVFYFISKSK